MSDFIVSFGIPLAYIALGIAALSAIAFPVIFMVQDPKKMKSAFIGLGALVVVFLISYLLADNTVYGTVTDPGQMKFINAGLLVVYILLAISIVTIIYASVSRYFK